MEHERQDAQGMSMGQKTLPDFEPKREKEKKKLDLSVAQVAGSSLATVAAAVLASGMGLYGTIIGAGIVSVVATAGGPVIQHFFRRTGDQLRETARPKARQVPVYGPGPASEGRAPDGTMLLGTVPVGGPPPDEDFGHATVHGTRVRGWKRTAVASAVVFAVSIGGIATYEVISGNAVSSGGTTTWGGTARNAADSKPAPGTGTGKDGGGKGGKSPGAGNSPSPPDPKGSPSPGSGRSPAPSHSPSSKPSPSPSPDASPSPSPSPDVSPSPSPKPEGGKVTPSPGPGQESPAP
ncbi:hypothetical protein [Streptomyces sp. NBC_01264]|uniref:hypothetical protein n=1 Tax=Streptomyces sp. NBC_01264 TaxID=2903804 RepID=UPI00225190EB|nr:hypothetical protein [Streptomyces sp. NBC_01264]MCX4783499.1 hypothetical protein [Streptomyces sp. NBC_01264]